MSAANLSIPVAVSAVFPLATRTDATAPEAISQETSDFTKLIESLIGGEVATVSPTQFPGQDKSVVLSLKDQGVNTADIKTAAKGQKTPKAPSEPRDPNEQQKGGLLAMMVAVPSARTKPTLSLNFGRSTGEDHFIQSAKSTDDKHQAYAPERFIEKPQPVIPQPQPLAPLAPAPTLTVSLSVPVDGTPSPQPVPRPFKESNTESIPIGSTLPTESRIPTPFLQQNQVRGRVQDRVKDQAPKDEKPQQSEDVVVQPETLIPAVICDRPSTQNAVTDTIPVPVSTSYPAPALAQGSIVIPLALPVPKSISPGGSAKDRPSDPDQLRLKLELPTDSRQAQTLPLAIGKVPARGQTSSEPIAFAARLTEREQPEDAETTKPSVTQSSQKQTSLAQPYQSPLVPGKAEPENVPTNPKQIFQSTGSQSSSETVVSKPKGVATERAAENVPTNPKSPAAFVVPEHEPSARAPQSFTKSSSALEVKGSAPMPETELQAKPTIRSEPAREISIRIPSADNGNVDVQIVERDGKVQVTVRGSDTQLNAALRGELTELVHTLDQKGYKTETWTPGDTYPLTPSSAREVQTPSRGEPSQDWSGNQPKDGGNGGQSGGNPQQRRQQQVRPDWLIELERRLETEG